MNKNIKDLFDKIYKCLDDRVYIETSYEEDDGRRYCGEVYTIDEITCNLLSNYIDRLYELLED